jgi:hypothetical protein
MAQYDTGEEDSDRGRWERLMQKTREKVRELGINEDTL